MSPRGGVAILLVGWAALQSGVALAQGCNLEETMSVCYNRLSALNAAAARTDAANTATTAAVEEAKTDNAGVDTAAAGTASATKNFIPLLRFAGLVGDGVTTQDGLVAFDVNFPFPTGSDDAQLQIVVNPSPTLHEALGSALDTLGDAALRDELEGDLSDSDDMRLSFTYGKQGDNLGRDFEQYRKVFTSLVEGAVKNAADPAAAASASTAYQSLLVSIQADLLAALPQGAASTDNVRLGDLTNSDTRARLMAGIAAAAAQHKNSERFLGELVTGNQLHRFADLVANQPQLYVSLERRLGSELTGPQRTSVDLTWERGLVSLGNFYKDAPDGCKQDQLVATTVAPPTGDPPPWAPATCLTAFKNFVMENEDAINSAGRSAFSLRYSKIERYAFSRPLSGLNVTVPSTEKLAASFTFGRKFVAAERRAIVGDDSRVDFIVKYEHSDDETVLNSRTIAGFTFSRKLGDNIVPVTLLYADKGEMAGDSGSQITVNFGMAFQLIQ